MAEKDFKREIFAIVGLPPEVLAVAMAKYSRSAASIKETINELTEEKSAEFHEKWVLGYGDASVADMAVVSLALENVSILASKTIEDNRLASYQEKSTRYQPFDPSRFYFPEINDPEFNKLYKRTINLLFETYQKVTERMINYFREKFPKPEELKEKPYESKLRARSLDVARYFLPTATLTNFGMIMNARSLRHAISKLKSSPYKEFQEIGQEIQEAAVTPAYNPQEQKVKSLIDSLLKNDSEEVKEVAQAISQNLKLLIKGAPTLVKYTEPKEYLIKSKANLQKIAAKFLKNLEAPKTKNRVEFFEPKNYEEELVATLLYSVSHYSFGQILKVTGKMSPDEKEEVLEATFKERGPHDWPRREFEVGGNFVFDTLMDYGAFRDLQRHRICTQINQDLSIEHGFEIPKDLEEAGLLPLYLEVMEKDQEAVAKLAAKYPLESRYLIALGFKKRTLFKMNLRELYHLVELRTKAGGHFSYRNLCYEMYELVKKRHPLLVKDLRAIKPNYDKEFFDR